MDVKPDVIVDACVVVDSTAISEAPPQAEAHKSKQLHGRKFRAYSFATDSKSFPDLWVIAASARPAIPSGLLGFIRLEIAGKIWLELKSSTLEPPDSYIGPFNKPLELDHKHNHAMVVPKIKIVEIKF